MFWKTEERIFREERQMNEIIIYINIQQYFSWMLKIGEAINYVLLRKLHGLDIYIYIYRMDSVSPRLYNCKIWLGLYGVWHSSQEMLIRITCNFAFIINITVNIVASICSCLGIFFNVIFMTWRYSQNIKRFPVCATVQTVNGSLITKPGFNSSTFQLGFLVDIVAVGQVILWGA
jgi:hypothetical protein